jgi:hypothetical protein
MRVALVLTCLTGSIAAADPACPPWSLTATASGGLEVAPLAADDVFGRMRLAVDWEWRRRWLVGVALGFAVDATANMDLPGADIRTYLVEAGVRLQPSPRLGVLLGWRVGRAGINFGFAYAHVTDIEPVADMIVPLARAVELRIEPLSVDLYDSSTWQITFGAQIGLAWRWPS